MKRRSIGYGRACLAFLLGVILAAGSPAIADDPTAAKEAAPSPVRLDRDKLAGVGLPPSEPFVAPDDVLAGTHRPRGVIVYQGEELVMEIYEDEEASFAIRAPYPVDEFVQVLSGKLILTDARGQEQEYVQGDSLVVPKGFTGIWEMRGNFRELIAVERVAYERAFGSLPGDESGGK